MFSDNLIFLKAILPNYFKTINYSVLILKVVKNPVEIQSLHPFIDSQGTQCFVVNKS